MPSSWDKNKGYSYVASDYDFNSRTHGGHSAEHKREMEEVANDIFNKKMEQIVSEIEQSIYTRAINDLLGALKIDMTSIVTVGMTNAKEIFYGEKCQTAIMNAVMDEIRKHLGNTLYIRY